MKKIILLISLFLFPILILNNEIEERKRYMTLEEEKSIINYFSLLNLKDELNELFADINFNIDNINSEHLIYMEKHRVKNNIPKSIFYRLILRESWFNEYATSPVGARGYMQIMPSTFEYLKLKYNLPDADINCSYDNIKMGSKYLAYNWNKINERYPNEDESYKWRRVLASYNAGYSVHLTAMYNYNETINYIKFVLNH